MASTCGECGRPITWAKSAEGKNVPIQRVPAYELSWSRQNGGDFDRSYQAHMIKIDTDTYISHFDVCPGRKKNG